MAGVTDVIQDATGNRRSVGARNHCMHGKDEILEEVLDWRPFDYFTIRSTVQTPGGPIRIENTFEIEPTPAGSRISLRFRRPADRAEAALVEPMAPVFQGMIDTGAAKLRSLLDEATQARAEAAPDEPDLPAPKADGVLADLAAV
jgi:hypothetical protein